MAPATLGRITAIAVTVVIAGILLTAAASAQAAASYVFEPTRSLTGNCATSAKLDPVPDPGVCPIPPGTTFSGSPGADHPSKRLEAASVTIDSYGDIYIASMMTTEGRIDVFSPNGNFITEFADTAGPQSLAVDAEGNVYVFERNGGEEPQQVRRFPPKVYEPEKEEIEYGEEPVLLVSNKTKPVIPLSFESSLAVEPATQRLYVDTSHAIAIFGSAKEENKLLEPEAITGLVESSGFAIDAKHKKIYIADKVPITAKSIIRIFELGPPHNEVGKITGSTTPKGEFLSGEGFIEVDVDEATGHIFVGDVIAASKVYEFEENGNYLATIEHSFEASIGPGGTVGEIAVDNVVDDPGSPLPQKEGWLFVPSAPSPSAGHVYAFEPNEECAAEVESTSVGDITETEATLRATINPCGLETTYRLEYVSQQQFEEESGKSFEEGSATLASEGTLPKGGEGIAVSAAATELEPGTKYRFRVFAENTKGKAAEEKAFTTFPAEEKPPVCENDPLRIGLSALLPDCRAYELVTPADTNGRPPSGGFAGLYFPTQRSAPDGNHATFVIEGGLIPGSKGTGAFNGDNYLASRGEEGWTTELAGPLGEEAGATKRPSPGGVSPDQGYSFWEDTDGDFIRHPDGHSELIGRGSLGEDPQVDADLITENASHIIFGSNAELEPNSPPVGTTAVYDRSAEGPTHVISLLPGNITPGAKEDASYLGASEDGEGIAFAIADTIYLRLHNEETFEVADPAAKFMGVFAGGTRVFYTEGGNLYSFDAEEPAEPIQFSESGDVTVVNVASDGTRAYFVSPSKLTSEHNPNGEEAQSGAENLYLSREGVISFVGIVTEEDVKPMSLKNPAANPFRATPSGATLLFGSRADLTGFDSGGFVEIYRYDSTQGRLTCLSCNPTGTPPSSNASLQSIQAEQFSPEPAGSFLKIPSQTPDGGRAFFQSAEPLNLSDTDGKLDVYEWEEKGVGSCEKVGGCVYLISGGQSSGPDYLYAMSQTGDDVFFRTSDQLLPRDTEATLSIYDARVGGGFLEPEPEPECIGEGCHPASTPPALSSPAKPAQGAEDQVVEKKKHCPKGKHVAKRRGKKVCVKNHHKKHRRGTSSKKNGGSR